MLILGSCRTAEHRVSLGAGLAPDFLAYVPARIAVLPAQLWPVTSGYDGWQASNSAPEAEKAQLAALDQAVLGAFSNQPLMNGYTPRLVQRLLAQAGATDLMSQQPILWRARPAAVVPRDPLDFYRAQVQERTEWRFWLGRISSLTRHCDAILMPFLLHSREETLDDRGLMLARRQVAVAVLLVDVESGRLIWGRMRPGQVTAKRLIQGGDPGFPPFPEWETVMARVLVDELWADFPGRKVEGAG